MKKLEKFGELFKRAVSMSFALLGSSFLKVFRVLLDYYDEDPCCFCGLLRLVCVTGYGNASLSMIHITSSLDSL